MPIYVFCHGDRYTYPIIYALIGLCCACGDPANLMCLGFVPSFGFSCFLLNNHSLKVLPQILFLELIAATVPAGFLLPEITLDSVFSIILIKTFVSTLAAIYCFYTISFFNLKMTSIFESMTSLLKCCIMIGLGLLPIIVSFTMVLFSHKCMAESYDSIGFWQFVIHGASSPVFLASFLVILYGADCRLATIKAFSIFQSCYL